MEKLLLEAARVFNSTLEYEDLMELVLRLVLKAVNAEVALVFRIDHQRTDMKIRLMKATENGMKTFDRELGQGVVGWVAQYREAIVINDPGNDDRVDRELARLGGFEIRSLISVPLVGRGQMIGVVAAINKDDGEFTDADMDVLIGLNNQMAVAIDNAHLYREVRRESSERHALFEIGKKLASSVSMDDLLEEILSSLHQVVQYDAGGIFLVDPETDDMSSLKTVGYAPGSKDNVKVKIGQGLVGHVAATGVAEIVSDVTATDHYIKVRESTRSEIAVPVKLNDHVSGVLILESDKLDAFDKRTTMLLEVFASQAAVSIERARMMESIMTGQKLREQLNVARAIQRTFLPDHSPSLRAYDISGTNIPSGQVGGDYYDFIDIVDGHLGVAIGDVSGKGMPAALIMASFRASLIAEIRNNYAIRTICAKVNSLLCESMEPGNFVTAVYSVLDFKNHILTFANCGHDRPILLRRDGSVEFLEEGGPVLGVTEAALYEERPVFLNPGDICVFYTDGVTEVFDSSGEQFGLDRLVQVVRETRHQSAEQIQEAVLKAVGPFASPDHLFDDLTLVVLKRKPE